MAVVIQAQDEIYFPNHHMQVACHIIVMHNKTRSIQVQYQKIILYTDYSHTWVNTIMYVVLPKISENLSIPRKPLALRTCAARCLFLHLSTNSVATGVFISARVSEFLAVFFTPFSRVSAIIEMAGVKEQRTCIKFCFELNKTAAETNRMLKDAYIHNRIYPMYPPQPP